MVKVEKGDFLKLSIILLQKRMNEKQKNKTIEFCFWYKISCKETKLLNLNDVISQFLEPWLQNKEFIYENIFLKTMNAYVYKETFLPLYSKNPNYEKASISTGKITWKL